MNQLTSPGRLKVVVGIAAAILVGTAAPAVAEGDLRIEASAVYELNPEASRLEVTVTFVLTNQKPSTLTTRYYYDSFPLLLPDEAEQVTAADGSGRSLHTTETTEELNDGSFGRVVTVDFPRRVFHRGQQVIVLSFYLPGGAPRSESTVRANPAYAAFPAWAWGDPGLSDVAIRIPTEFEVNFVGDGLNTKESDGYTTWSRTAVDNPGDWVVYFTARNDSALISEVIEVEGLTVTVRSWPGDDTWAQRVADVVERGLPVLHQEIGLGFDEQTTLEVLESIDPTILGYAGWYLTKDDVIELGEDLDDHIILHEVSHLWANDDLFITRWISEGLAEELSSTAFDDIDGVGDPELGEATPPPRGLSIAVPLNRWDLPQLAPSEDEESARREDYGYNASFWVIHTLREEIGSDALQAVLAAAAEDLTAYQVGPDPETVNATDGWWRFLDLLEEVGGSTTAADIFRDLVAAPEDLAVLDARSEAREAYSALVAADTEWDTPWAVRQPLGEWEFPAAEQSITAAQAVVTLRDQVVEVADRLSLVPPAALEDAYENAESPDDLAAAATVGEEQLDSVTAVAEARDAIDAPRGFFNTIGLMGADPETPYQASATAFEEGRHEDAATAAADVVAIMDGAADVGQSRVLWAAGILVLVGAGITVLVVLRKRRNAPVAVETPEA